MDSKSLAKPRGRSSDARLDDANAIVSRYVKYTVATGLIPIPFVDLAMIAGLQLNMVRLLSMNYDVEFSEQRGKAAIAALVSGSSAVSLASAAQAIPGLGLAAGIFVTTVTAGVTTHAVGQVFIQHYEAGGTLLTFDPHKVREYYQHELEQEVQVVAEESSIGRKP
jgi:uncharacterized protein (DUF697 family)